LDYSEKQLESERFVASREGYEVRTVRADMTKPWPFTDESFDLILFPVANCYIESMENVWTEAYRVLKQGGRILSGLDNGLNFLFDEEDESRVVGFLPYNPLKNPEQMAELIAGDYGVEFSHSISDIIGGQLRAGLRLADIYDDTNGSGFLHDHGAPCYYATLSVKD
ncbi:MAG: class I SAM-dependent methyltransferase, partial [Lachnospiraceae bacterium]|nr:class I SAM-dependent methyltransferase [Lachnospiraceae bacterium]